MYERPPGKLTKLPKSLPAASLLGFLEATITYLALLYMKILISWK